MPTRRSRPRGRRTRARTRRPIRAAAARAAAARAVARVLASRDAFALLVRRLEAAGWRVEREPGRTETLHAAPPRSLEVERRGARGRHA